MLRNATLLAVLVGLGLGGCANNATFRSVAGQNAEILNRYRSMLKGAADRQTALNANNERRIRDLDVLRNEAQAYTRYRLVALETNKDDDALAVFKLMSAKRAADVVGESQALGSLAPGPAPAVVNIDAGQIEALIEQLTDLSEKPSDWDQLAVGLGFAGELNAAFDATAETTKNETKTAEAAAATLDAAAKPK